MIWFWVAAAISVSAFDWNGGGGSRRFWVAAMASLAAFGIALALPAPGAGGECVPGAPPACRAGFVAFAGLFLLSSICLGVGAVFRRLSSASFAVLALSDVVLMVAVRTRVEESSSWTLPEAGDWGGGAKWGVLAAILRLGAPLAASGPSHPVNLFKTGGDRPAGSMGEAVLLSVGWWQGALLALWIGSPGRALLALGGLALWPAAVVVGRSRVACLCAAGGLLSLGAAAQAPAAGLAAVGLAGVALVLGAHGVGIWLLAVLPVSLLTVVELPVALNDEAGLWLGLAVLFPPAWSLLAFRLSNFVAGAAASAAGNAPLAGGVLASSAALGAALAGFPHRAWVTWALVGGAAGAFASLKLSGASLLWRSPVLVRPVEAKAGGRAEPPSPPLFRARRPAGARLGTAAGWGLLSLASVVFGRLIWAGLQTGFL